MSDAIVTPEVGAHPNEDLRLERERSPLDLKRMSDFIYGPEMYVNLMHLSKIMESAENRDDLDLRHVWSVSGEERYMKACRIARALIQLIRKHKLMDCPKIIGPLQALTGEDMFLYLHLTMFLPCLEAMCDEEQARYWVPLARDFRILGTYSQTELGHGSNVPGLETQAVYDPRTQTFTVNTPTLQSTKWWAGGLAKSSTHCILMAQLIIKDKTYGVHPFILQLRCLDTHRSLPGITLIHCGQKMGYNGMDNGGVRLKDVVIPRRQMLMRFSSVASDGTYTTNASRKLVYSTLTYTRKQIILAAGSNLARSVVIAIRYSAVRRQFPLDLAKMGDEAQVLDYRPQQRTLMPILAQAIGFLHAGIDTDKKYDVFMGEVKVQNFDKLEEIHCITSCLKAFMTLTVSESIEKCRKACGGHGYMLASGVSSHFLNFVPQATYEGDFVVLSIQTGRSLLKTVQKKMNGDVAPDAMSSSFRYIYAFDPLAEHKACARGEEKLEDREWLIKVFEQRASVLVFLAAQKFATISAEASGVLVTLDRVKVAFTHITHAHAHVLILNCFKETIDQCAARTQTHAHPEKLLELQVLEDLFTCLALAWMEEHLTEFVRANAVSVDVYDTLTQTLERVCARIRTHAIAVTDAFNFSDRFLNSALGRYDGDVYTALLDSARAENLNKKDVPDAYYEHLQYIIHPERAIPKQAKL